MSTKPDILDNDTAEKRIREEYGEIAISSGTQVDRKIHAPHPDGGSLCHNLHEEDCQVKDASVYPIGWWPVCDHCRKRVSEAYQTEFSSGECIAALRGCTKSIGKSPTRVEYKEWWVRGMRPSVVAIVDAFGTWNRAKREAGLETFQNGENL